jgi:Prokaryotic Cytochrome C oxidase subunit IV
MAALLFTRTTLIWLLLVGATVLSWAMGHGAGFADLRYASITIIVVALVKVRFVILEFMEIRTAPLFMRLTAEIWLLVIGAVLIILYWKGTH